MTSIEAAVDRLSSLPGASPTWKQIATLGNEALIRALDRAMGDGTSHRDRLIMRSAEDGYDWRTGPVDRNGKVKPSASRFLHHLLATIDLTVQLQGVWDGEYRAGYLRPVRDSYQQMKEHSGRRSGPLTDHEIRMARTYCLESAMGLDLYSDDVEYFAKHYDKFEPYINVIVQRGSMYHRDLEVLLETSPQPSLAEGTL